MNERIAVISDIHGNLPALEAVLGDIRQQGVDQLIFCGDVFPGPMPNETLACLLESGIPTRFIHGNGDREVVALMSGEETEWYRSAKQQWREPIHWTAQQLSEEHRLVVSRWPATYRAEINHLGEVLFCHATPRNDTEIFTRLTAEDRLSSAFRAIEVSVVFCGHTHMQFDRTVGRIRIVNAGSVGMPFGEPGAYWALLGPDVQLRRTGYDINQAAERIRRTRYPQAWDFAERNVLHPPSEASMLEVFACAELK